MVVTIKDVAKKVGVSYSTVSRALNDIGTRNTENKKRILKLAREMGYVPSQVAINLKLSGSYTIGPYFSTISKMSSPFVLHDVLTGMYSIVGSKYSVMVKGIDIYEKDTLNPSFYGGIIMLSQWAEDGEFIEEVMAKNIPMVAICRTVFYDVPDVATDKAKAIGTAMDYLLGHDHRKIGATEGNPGLDPTRLRGRGWHDPILKHGLDPNDLPVEIGNYRYASDYQAAKKLVEEHQGLTTVLCFNDEIAFAAKTAIYETGLTAPDDISLIRFDNWDMSGCGNMRLTTVERNMSEIAKEGARVLLRRSEDDVIDNRRVYLNSKLIVRETVKDIR